MSFSSGLSWSSCGRHGGEGQARERSGQVLPLAPCRPIAALVEQQASRLLPVAAGPWPLARLQGGSLAPPHHPTPHPTPPFSDTQAHLRGGLVQLLQQALKVGVVGRKDCGPQLGVCGSSRGRGTMQCLTVRSIAREGRATSKHMGTVRAPPQRSTSHPASPTRPIGPTTGPPTHR